MFIWSERGEAFARSLTTRSFASIEGCEVQTRTCMCSSNNSINFFPYKTTNDNYDTKK